MAGVTAAMTACGSDSTTPEVVDLTGTWDLNAQAISQSGLTCQWARVQLSLTQSGETVSGSYSGGARTCVFQGQTETVKLDTGQIHAGMLNGSSISFVFGPFTMAGTFGAKAMGGTISGAFTSEGLNQSDFLAGDWTAER